MMSMITSWDRVHFWIYLLNCNSLSHQTLPINRYKLGQKLSGIFWTIWRTGAKFQVLFNLGISSNNLVTNYVKIPQRFIFLESWKIDIKKLYIVTIKNCQISLYCNFNEIIKEPGTSFQSSVLSQNYLSNVCITAY